MIAPQTLVFAEQQSLFKGILTSNSIHSHLSSTGERINEKPHLKPTCLLSQSIPYQFSCNVAL